MSSRYSSTVRQQAELSAFANRSAADWQAEALATLRSGALPSVAPLPLADWVAAQRREAIARALSLSDWILIRATERAQERKRDTSGRALHYAPATAAAILAAIPAEQLQLLAVGRCRSLRTALREAAHRHPDKLRRDERSGGWRAIGEPPRFKPDTAHWQRDEKGRRTA